MSGLQGSCLTLNRNGNWAIGYIGTSQQDIEATHETLQELNKLADGDVVKALNELKQPKKYIRGMNGNQMNVDLVATTIDDKRKFPIKALLDSGCSGSCIDKGFVKAKGVKLGVRTEMSGPKSCEALASTCRLRRSLDGCLEFRSSGRSRRVRSRAEKKLKKTRAS